MTELEFEERKQVREFEEAKNIREFEKWKARGLTSRARWFLVSYIALRMPHCELLRGVITKL